jgi:hypothetical protein
MTFTGFYHRTRCEFGGWSVASGLYCPASVYVRCRTRLAWWMAGREAAACRARHRLEAACIRVIVHVVASQVVRNSARRVQISKHEQRWVWCPHR